MEVEENSIQTSQQQQAACKYSRVSSNGAKIATQKPKHEHKHEPNTTSATVSVTVANNGVGGGGGGGGDVTAMRRWQNSSRIIRVSRASGGKDRHSKVWTAKGPRDRRVRLSVHTAIQFYDLQDRLGYDQPSKAVEWLIKAAADAINELPSLDAAATAFPPETPRIQMRGVVEDEGLDRDQKNTGSVSVSKSGCSSNNSETSKGSGGLSLSRTEIRVKARERARERTAKEKDREIETVSQVPTTSMVSIAAHPHQHQHEHQHQHQHQHTQQNVGSMNPQTSSFTQLLTAGISSLNESNNSPSSRGNNNNDSNNNNSNHHQWLSSTSTTAMDYFGGGLMGLSSSSGSLPQVMTISPFAVHHNHDLHQHHQQQQQQFSFVSDQQQQHHIGGHDQYNLSFSISPSSAGFNSTSSSNNRGTLQSNSVPSPSPLLPNYLHQRFSAATDGSSSVPFFLGGASIENHHHHQQHQFQPSGLQLCYDDRQQSDQKGKGKNS